MTTSVEDRLTRLESSVRAWRKFSACLMLIIAATMLLGAERNIDALRAQKLTLYDEKTGAAMLLTVEDGEPSIQLRANASSPTLVLASDSSSASITVGRGKQKPYFSISGDTKTGGFLFMHDAEGNRTFAQP